jgi:hypothetical protein
VRSHRQHQHPIQDPCLELHQCGEQMLFACVDRSDLLCWSVDLVVSELEEFDGLYSLHDLLSHQSHQSRFWLQLSGGSGPVFSRGDDKVIISATLFQPLDRLSPIDSLLSHRPHCSSSWCLLDAGGSPPLLHWRDDKVIIFAYSPCRLDRLSPVDSLHSHGPHLSRSC